jgi:hypothetical protein
MKNSYLATHLMVLFDRDGRILAGVPVYDGYAGPVPLAGEGQEVAHFDLPEAERGRPAREIDVTQLCTTLKVDTRRRVLKALDSTTD